MTSPFVTLKLNCSLPPFLLTATLTWQLHHYDHLLLNLIKLFGHHLTRSFCNQPHSSSSHESDNIGSGKAGGDELLVGYNSLSICHNGPRNSSWVGNIKGYKCLSGFSPGGLGFTLTFWIGGGCRVQPLWGPFPLCFCFGDWIQLCSQIDAWYNKALLHSPHAHPIVSFPLWMLLMVWCHPHSWKQWCSNIFSKKKMLQNRKEGNTWIRINEDDNQNY